MIKFVCPSCGKELSVKDEATGKRGKCRKCGEDTVVPKATDEPVADQVVTERKGEPIRDSSGADSKLSVEHGTTKRESTYSTRSHDPDWEFNISIVLVLLCAILSIRGCVVVLSPTLSEYEKQKYAELDRESSTGLLVVGEAKKVFEDSGDYRYKQVIRSWDDGADGRLYRLYKEKQSLGTPRVGEAILTFFAAAICLWFAHAMFIGEWPEILRVIRGVSSESRLLLNTCYHVVTSFKIGSTIPHFRKATNGKRGREDSSAQEDVSSGRERVIGIIATVGCILFGAYLVVWAVFLRDTWETDNMAKICDMSSQTIELIRVGQLQEGMVKYEALMALVSGHKLEMGAAIEAIATARENVEPIRQRLDDEILAKVRDLEARAQTLAEKGPSADEISLYNQALDLARGSHGVNPELKQATDRITSAKSLTQAWLAEIQRLQRETTPSATGLSAYGGNDLFYDPGRSLPYMANRASLHSTRSEAIGALAEQFGNTPSWVEANMGSSNDLMTIHTNLGNAMLTGSSLSTGVGRVNYGLVETVKRSWINERMHYGSRDEQSKAITAIVLIVRHDISDSADCEATLDYIEANIGSWR